MASKIRGIYSNPPHDSIRGIKRYDHPGSNIVNQIPLDWKTSHSFNLPNTTRNPMAKTPDIAETISTLLQLAGNLYSLGIQYIAGTVKAPCELRSLVNELHSLGNVLFTLREFTAANTAPRVLKLLNGSLPVCYRDLEDLQKWLIRGGGNCMP